RPPPARANGRGAPRARLGQARRACVAHAVGGSGDSGAVNRPRRLILVAIAPPALPFVLAPPPPAKIDREDADAATKRPPSRCALRRDFAYLRRDFAYLSSR